MKISIHVKPNAKADQVEIVDDIYVVRTKARAVDGKANEAAVQLLAEYLGIPKTRLRIVLGATSRHKVIEIVQ
jgi:uncharacterized protein YggU (UPF0235/DUF167 family)